MWATSRKFVRIRPDLGTYRPEPGRNRAMLVEHQPNSVKIEQASDEIAQHRPKSATTGQSQAEFGRIQSRVGQTRSQHRHKFGRNRENAVQVGADWHASGQIRSKSPTFAPLSAGGDCPDGRGPSGDGRPHWRRRSSADLSQLDRQGHPHRQRSRLGQILGPRQPLQEDGSRNTGE